VSSTEVVLWQRHETRPLRGDIANLYPAGPGLLKLARDPADNDLMRREAAALTQLRDQVDPRFGAYFPKLVQAQRQHDPRSGIERRANLIGRLSGFRSLAEVRAAFPAGIDPRDAAWMWRRLLASPRRRPQDAWQLLAEFDELLERLYGPRTYRPFAMPA